MKVELKSQPIKKRVTNAFVLDAIRERNTLIDAEGKKSLEAHIAERNKNESPELKAMREHINTLPFNSFARTEAIKLYREKYRPTLKIPPPYTFKGKPLGSYPLFKSIIFPDNIKAALLNLKLGKRPKVRDLAKLNEVDFCKQAGVGKFAWNKLVGIAKRYGVEL